MKILILGGYGVFGGRLAQLLLRDGQKVILAGRSNVRAAAFCEAHGGVPLELDLSDPAALRSALSTHRPDVVVDAAGPFQGYNGDYTVARAAIAHGCHYLDLSDDAAFCAGIGLLDEEARAAGCLVLSGVSSVPALSGAAVSELANDLIEIALIDTAILPGNRAPRGHSVMAAILSQVGAPLRLWRGGRWTETPGWSGQRRIALGPDLRRPAGFIGAPDLLLFPAAFNAGSVLFRAGLELPLMHRGLQALGALRRLRLLPRLDRFTRPLQRIANALTGFGSDRGGMVVSVAGRDTDGAPHRRNWTLIAEAGQGPFIPAVPARAIIRKLASGAPTPGARPAIREFSLAEAEAAMSELAISTTHTNAAAPTLFEHALGSGWQKMPEAYRRMHEVWDSHRAEGAASVTRGRHSLARLIAALFRFPPATDAIPVSVEMQRVDETERWVRTFGGRRFRSTLSPSRPDHIHERFGPFRFELALPITDQGMAMTVTRGWCLGLPMPRWALPHSDTREYVEDGRFHFDVKISARWQG